MANISEGILDAERSSFSVTFDNDEIVKFSDTMIEKVGQMVANALRRKRSVLLCANEGHPQSSVLNVSGICGRCWLVVDEEQYAKSKVSA